MRTRPWGSPTPRKWMGPDACVACLAAVAWAVVLALGCAAVPLRERDDTLALLEQAREAGADAYAPEEYHKARAAFIEAQEKIDADENKEGLEAFHRAARAAEEAKAQAIANRPALVPTPEPKPLPPPRPPGAPAGPVLRVPGLEPPQVVEPIPPGSPTTTDDPVPTPEPAAAPGWEDSSPGATVPATVPLLEVGETKRPQAPAADIEDAPDPARIHLVKKGETLSSIAKRELGSEAAWREIYEMNRDRLKTPRSLQAGMELRIPAR